MDNASSVVFKESTSIDAANTTDSTSVKCSICPEQFRNLQEVLKHDLQVHMRKKRQIGNNQEMPSLELIDENDVRQALDKVEPGDELATILKFYCIGEENLDLVYSHIETDLQMELRHLRVIQIQRFGSIGSGLALRDCDIDIYIELPCELNARNGSENKTSSFRKALNAISSPLHRSKLFAKVFAIRHARVPIVKCLHIPTGFNLDINVSSPSSLHNTKFLRDVTNFDQQLQDCMLFCKIWAKKLQLIGTHGNMRSYCLATLVLFFLQQPYFNDKPLLPSIRQLQSQIPAQMVLGVNYAYDLRAHAQCLPVTLTTLQLLHGFFDFYAHFDFENCIASPYLGTAIPVGVFRAGEYKFPELDAQLDALNALNGSAVELFQSESCMRVQDPFALNHNIAKSILPPNLVYFQKCLVQALQKFVEANAPCSAKKDASIYEKLLYDIPVVARTITEPLTYRYGPRRADLQALASHIQKTINDSELYRQWTQHCIEAICVIVSQVYVLHMEPITDTTSIDKYQQKRLKHTDFSCAWLLSGNVDMWTGRQHKRDKFLEYQLAQTSDFQRQRHSKSAFAVQFSGVLTLNIISNYKVLELSVTPSTPLASLIGVSKKDPLRRFFNMFKNSMQNFNLTEMLETGLLATKWTQNCVHGNL